jgi:hypothetical protein
LALQCKKCSAEINTSGFRWSYRVKCAQCGALYEPDRIRNTAANKYFWHKLFLYIIFFQIVMARKDIDKYFAGAVGFPVGTTLWILCIAVLVAFEFYRAYRYKKIHGVGSQWRYVGTKEALRRKRRRQFNLDAKILLGVLVAALLMTIVLFKLAY